MKKKIIIALISIAVIVLAGFITLKIMSRNAERNVETEKAIVISATQLAAEFSAQEDSANKKYLNNTLEISGTVASIDSNDNHQQVVLLKDAAAPAGILVTFKKKPENIAAGNTITIKGICTGFLSNVTLTDGVLIDVKQAAPPKPDSPKAPPVDTLKAKPVKDTLAVKTVKTFSTSKAQVLFDAGGGVEDIKATNSQAEATITSEGSIKFKLAILGFKFSDALMQEHFNDTYLESKQYPTAAFHGSITNIKQVDLEKDGTYKATVAGELTIHGVTQKINTTATLTVTNGKLKAQSTLNIKVADYKISTDATSSAVLTITAAF